MPALDATGLGALEDATEAISDRPSRVVCGARSQPRAVMHRAGFQSGLARRMCARTSRAHSSARQSCARGAPRVSKPRPGPASLTYSGAGSMCGLRTAASIGAATALEPTDSANGHVLVAQNLAGQTHTAYVPWRPAPPTSALVIAAGSPATNSTRHVVHRARPPQAWTGRYQPPRRARARDAYPAGTANVPTPSTVNCGM